MSKILCVYENEIASVSTAREFYELEKVRNSGIHARFVSLRQINNVHMNWCDVLLLIRPNHKAFSYLAKKGKQTGKFVIVNCDDDLLHLPKGLPRMSWRREGLISTLSYCDAVLSPNPYICRRFQKYMAHPRSAVLDTAVPAESIRSYAALSAKADEGSELSAVKIVYAAGIAHTALFDAYIRPVLPQLCMDYGNKISLACIGVCPDLREFEDKIQIEYIPARPLKEYRKIIAQGHYDLGLAPLGSDGFSKAKYFNKFIEYAMMGIAGIYSDTEPYTFVVKDGVNGFLAKNTKESWLFALRRAIEDPQTREKCKENAYKLLAERFSLEAVIRKLLSDIPELKSYKAPDRSPHIGLIQYLYRMSLSRDWVYKLFFYTAHGGIKELYHHIVHWIADKWHRS